MSQSVYLKRGTNEKINVLTTYKGNAGNTVFYRNSKGVEGHMGLAKFKKIHTWLSGTRV